MSDRRPAERSAIVVEHRPGAVVPLRDSSVISMAKVGALNSLQVEAAFRVANLVQQANTEAGRQFSEYVDGGARHPLAERAAEAMRELRRIRQLLGQHGYGLVVTVCAEGHGLVDLYATRRQRDTAADLLRLHLDELAALWRLADR